MNVVLVRFRDGERRDLPLSNAKTVIGRKPECDLRIPTRDVSRVHCEITLQEGEVTVKDAGSSNGTYVNGRRVDEAVLGPGDRLTVGPITFIVVIDGLPQDVEPIQAPPLLIEQDEFSDTFELLEPAAGTPKSEKAKAAPKPPPKPAAKAPAKPPGKTAEGKAKPSKPAKPGQPTPGAPVAPVAPGKPGEEEVFELSADDFDLEDAISALDELEDEDDLP